VPPAVPVRMLEAAATAGALLHPLRATLLRELGEEPDSAAGLARRLDLSRQRLNYHLRQLEDSGLVELVETRRRGNCTERILQATARSYLISPAILGDLAADPEDLEDRFSSAYLGALAGRMIEDLTRLRGRADEAGKRLPTLALQTEIRFASQEAQNGFAEELTAALARLVGRYHDESATGGRTFRLVAGAYPRPREPGSDGLAPPGFDEAREAGSGTAGAGEARQRRTPEERHPDDIPSEEGR